MTNTPDGLLNEFLDRYDEFLISLQSELVQHGEKTRYWHEMWTLQPATWPARR
jgi:hypothetical protein